MRVQDETATPTRACYRSPDVRDSTSSRRIPAMAFPTQLFHGGSLVTPRKTFSDAVISWQEASMKRITITLLMLTLGVAGERATTETIKMRFSGTNVATTINLQPGTVTDETHLAGNGTLGAFTFRELHADGPSPQPPANCTGPSFAVVSGAGVFRFQNGSLLIVTVVDGSGA